MLYKGSAIFAELSSDSPQSDPLSVGVKQLETLRYHNTVIKYLHDLVPKGAHARGYALQLKIKHC